MRSVAVGVVAIVLLATACGDPDQAATLSGPINSVGVTTEELVFDPKELGTLPIEEIDRCVPGDGAPVPVDDYQVVTDLADFLPTVDVTVIARVVGIGPSRSILNPLEADSAAEAPAPEFSVNAIEYEVLEVVQSPDSAVLPPTLLVSVPTSANNGGCADDRPTVGAIEVLFLSEAETAASLGLDDIDFFIGRRVGLDGGLVNAYPPLAWMTPPLDAFDLQPAAEFIDELRRNAQQR